jgi:hypothetical protein
MAVARKHRVQEAPAAAPAAPRAELRQVNDRDAFGDANNPIGDQLIRLETAFTSEPEQDLTPYPGPVRLAILVGAPLALWGLIALAAAGVTSLF